VKAGQKPQAKEDKKAKAALKAKAKAAAAARQAKKRLEGSTVGSWGRCLVVEERKQGGVPPTRTNEWRTSLSKINLQDQLSDIWYRLVKTNTDQ
jgi:hypothetical protein